MSNDMFDGVLMNVVQKAEGIEGFYDAVFGFMRRKTDFFSAPDKAKATVIQQFERNLALFNEDKVRKELIEKKQAELKKKQEEEAKAKQAKVEEVSAPEADSKVEEITDEEAERIMNQEANGDNSQPEPVPNSEGQENDGEDSDDGEPPLVGNGLKTDKYSFTQTLTDIVINVFIPSHVKGKDLIVDYSQKRLKVQIKGQDPLVNGELFDKIIVDETLWTIDSVEGQKVAQITFDKVDKMKWWDCVIIGDAKINTKKIEPENSKLSDLDGETRQTVEKMMFDQQQKQKGLPTSDEMEKQNKLKEFMAAHPEMDFSKAKFS